MANKILYTILVVLSTLGVLFLVLLFWPESRDDREDRTAIEEVEEDEEEDLDEEEDPDDEDEKDPDDEDEKDPDEDEPESEEAESEAEAPAETEAADIPESGKDDTAQTASNGNTGNTGNAAGVHIPESELGDRLSFNTVTLDEQAASDGIFSNYDLTLVYVWGTYCGSCIEEMGEYASLGKSLPDNVNLVGMIIDVYEGVDTNVQDAYDILNGAGASFENLRISDSLYDFTSRFNYVPSSFFVNREGRIVGQILDGAGYQETVQRLDQYVD